ncbi:Protein atonal like protein 8 [Cyphomyrmex costatus]|uniref:Protein atonal like protein 8 n=2 Tax=Cyphomyrmex costatus TaxID=456900 RepID=A0A195CIZ1_9HYME|nr:Protein atonal like protein 8 [Cyphomyrmex costatus]
MADSERDSGSCSSADEDSRSSLHSPTSSEDSVEVQVIPISLRNKRKLAEPRKIQEPAIIAAPLKKRRFDPISEETTIDQEETRSLNMPNPFRPWIPASYKNESKTTATSSTVTSTNTISNTITTTTTTTTTMTTLSSEREEEKEERRRQQDETTQRLHESFRRLQHPTGHNRSAVASRRESRQRLEPVAPIATTTTSPSNTISLPHPRLQDEPLSLVVRNEVPRVPSHPAVSGSYEKTPSYMMEHLLAASSSRNHQNHQTHQSQGSHQNHQVAPTTSRQHHQGGQQRNYKNMTRERRIEANARERTRVHTISAAFDTLRRAIPAYSHNQKLSKLSVLRIACSYIMTLSKILGKDGEVMAAKNNGLAGLSSCVELVSRTIQTEGKLRKRKED